MAVRTYIPGILTFCKFLKRYLADNGEKLKQYMGDGLYSVLVLAVDIVSVLAEIISAGAPGADEPWTDFTSVTTLSSAQINQLQAAWDRFLATNGIVGG
jgi:hypothetical protein